MNRFSEKREENGFSEKPGKRIFRKPGETDFQKTRGNGFSEKPGGNEFQKNRGETGFQKNLMQQCFRTMSETSAGRDSESRRVLFQTVCFESSGF